ncbi:MAG TPA: hypothetical protein VJJ24_02165 [Candidatus Paceibacterota bacterium]
MKRYQRRRLTKLSLEILKGLALGGLAVSAFALPNIGVIMKMFMPRKENKVDRQKIRRAIENLKKNDLVQVKPSESYIESEIRLSRAGKELLEVESLVLPKPKKWDEKWRIVMFDIPEPFGLARRALSLKLRELGCYHYQNSVFVYPFDCRKEVEFIKKYFGFNSGIKYVEANTLEDQEKLEDFFKL